MRELFSLIFDFLTELLGLPVEWYWEWLILGIIGFCAYAIAFRFVGDLYQNGTIDGKVAGSAIHWIIRLIVFAVIWVVTYGGIWVVKMIFKYWIPILIVIGAILVIMAVICLIVRYRKKGKKQCVK